MSLKCLPVLTKSKILQNNVLGINFREEWKSNQGPGFSSNGLYDADKLEQIKKIDIP